jgi:ATP-binding cassette subfamily B protein
MVGERGVRLSGGQRQRIGIARALYKQADVLIFDEATSALDNETEQAVMQAIENLGGDLTIIIIAHRITTLKNCDQIIELSEGDIKKMGSYQDFFGIKDA